MSTEPGSWWPTISYSFPEKLLTGIHTGFSKAVTGLQKPGQLHSPVGCYLTGWSESQVSPDYERLDGVQSGPSLRIERKHVG